MSFRIRTIWDSGATLWAFLKKVEDGVETDVWDEVNDQWDAGPIPLSGSAEKITLTAGSGLEDVKYTGATATDLETYSGKVIVHIVEDRVAPDPDRIVSVFEAELSNGIEVSPQALDETAAVSIGAEANKEQSIPIFVKRTSTAAAATGNVLTTQIAEAGTGPSFSNTTNAASYSGSPGVYWLTLTAGETNVTNPQLIRVTTDDGGTGDYILSFGTRASEDVWASGGVNELILQAINTDTNALKNTDVPTLQTTVDALPTASEVGDAVWDEPIASHTSPGTAGNLVERLDVLAAGGAGELTPTLAGNLANLNAAVTTRATPAEVNTEVGNSIVQYHLDHLLAVDYNPASKPGSATALLNELVESDGGVSRFTQNALELAGGGGSGLTPAQVSAAVWDETRNDHTESGSFGEMAIELTAVLADTDEVQATLASGGTVRALLDGAATQSSVDNLNDLSTADVDARLAAIGLDHLVAVSVTDPDVVNDSIIAKLASATGVWSTFDESTDSLEAIRTEGGANWQTATGFSTDSAADIRAEIDSNSTQLAAIVADTDEVQTSLASGGAMHTLVSGRSSHSAADVRTEMDANSTRLATVEADTHEVQQTLASGGAVRNDIDTLVTESSDNSSDIDAIKASLEPGGTTHTQINNISATPNTLSAEFVSPARTWVADRECDTASNIITLSEADVATLAMDFTKILNPETSVALAGGVVRVEGDDDLSFGTPEVSQDHRNIHVKVSGQLSGKRYKIKVQCTTTDAEVIS